MRQGANDSPVLPGFEGVFRYWDQARKTYTSKVKTGEFFVSRVDEPITTTLGSCVSVCVRDPARGIGGINHFMLPLTSTSPQHLPADRSTRYGNYAIEHLVNTLMSYGADKSVLEFKVFGGAKVISGGDGNIGEENIRFIKSYFKKEGYRVASADLGGVWPRKIVYFPVSGRAMVKRLEPEQASVIEQEELVYMKKISSQEKEKCEIELF